MIFVHQSRPYTSDKKTPLFILWLVITPSGNDFECLFSVSFCFCYLEVLIGNDLLEMKHKGFRVNWSNYYFRILFWRPTQSFMIY